MNGNDNECKATTDCVVTHSYYTTEIIQISKISIVNIDEYIEKSENKGEKWYKMPEIK